MSQKRKQTMEERLRNKVEKQKDKICELRNRYRTIINNSGRIVIVWNREHQIIDWNNDAEKLLGWTKREAVNNNLIDFLLDKEEENFIKSLFLLLSVKSF